MTTTDPAAEVPPEPAPQEEPQEIQVEGDIAVQTTVEPLDPPPETQELLIKEADHEEMIAEATAAAIEAAASAVDVSAANAAVLAAATLIDAADVPSTTANHSSTSSNNKRKRYREKTFDEIEAEFPLVVDDEDEDDLEAHRKAHPNSNHNNSSSHEDLLAARRLKDRQRYATMTPDQRQAYNAKRREQYHRQSDHSRQRRRER